MTGTLLQEICARVAEVLVGSAWKGLALVACAALLLRCLPRLSAGVRTAVWTAVLLAVLCLPLVSLWGGTGVGANSGLVRAGSGWSLVIVAVWLLISLVRVMQLAASALRLRSIARRAVPVMPSPDVSALLNKDSLHVRLSVSADVSRPSVAGFLRPQILLPVGLLEELSGAELEHVLLHEMEHLRRRDDWTNLVQKLGLALFPLHPALIWLDRQLCRERELACDDGVLRVTRARKAYAACLARLAEDSMARRGLSLALGLLGVQRRSSELSGRVHRILRSPMEAMSRAQMRFAMAMLVTGVLGGTVLLARSPRLISFSGKAQTTAQVDSVPVMTDRPMPAFRAAHVVQAKAAMPLPKEQPRLRRLTRAVAAKRTPRTLLRQVAYEQNERAREFHAVMTAWSEVMETPHMTLAVATDAPNAQGSQPTYAAVPVRGGWLLIQL